jgi:VanZ family protein
VTLPHELVGTTIAGIFKGVPRSQYDLTILTIGLIILLSFGIYLFLQIKKLEKPLYIIAFFTFCLWCMAISLNMLIIVNIEIIHFIQYAALAILLFPLSKSFFTTIVLVLFLGAIDEAYQYYYLSPQRTNYYDFNDVILNLLGAVMGMIFLRSHIQINSLLINNANSFRKTWITYFFICLVISLLIWKKDLIQSGINFLGLELDWAGFGAVLIRIPTTSFWTEIPPQILYHVVQPFEGFVIVTILLFVFSFLRKNAE